MSTGHKIQIAEHLSYYRNDFAQYTQVIFDQDQIPNLRAILNRALNCWPEAPKELFKLAEYLDHGKPLTEHSPKATGE